MKLFRDIEKEASSKSINKTIGEVRRLMEGSRISTTGPLRKKLHYILHRLLREKACFWYQRGFKRGHETARAKSKMVPLEVKRSNENVCNLLTAKGNKNCSPFKD